MKTIFNMKWMSLLLVAVLSLGFVSCGDDDEEDDKNQQSVTASIFGTWVEDDDDYVLTLTLNQDGTGIVVLYDKTTKRETRDPFEYSYGRRFRSDRQLRRRCHQLYPAALLLGGQRKMVLFLHA